MPDTDQREIAQTGLRVVLIVCVVAYLATYTYRGFNPGTVAHAACWIAICSLSGFWVGFGNFRYRIPVAILVATMTALVSEGFTYRQTLLYLLFSLGMVGVVSATSFAVRIMFGELRQVDQSVSQVEAMQFSVRDMLLWTASVAVILTVGKWLVSIQANAGLDQIFMVLGLIGTLVTTSAVAIWSFLGQRISAGRVTVYLLTLALAALLNNIIIAMNGFWLITTPISQVPVIAVIYFLRRQDYRFIKVAAE